MSHEKLKKALRLAREREYIRREGPAELVEPGTYGPGIRWYGGQGYRDPGMEISEPRKQVLAAMGVPYRSTKIPKEAHGVAVVEGVTFKLHRHIPKGRKVSKHRLFAECPVCGKDVPVGRLHQHAVVHGFGDVEGHRRRYERMKARRATETRRSR